MATLAEKIGENIRRIRVHKNLSQDVVAEKADISGSYLSNIEHGKYNITIEVLERITNALEATIGDVLPKKHHPTHLALLLL